MQISEALDRIHGLAQVNTCRVGEILLGIGRHLPDLTNPLTRIGRSTWQTLGAEDQEAYGAEDDQLADADIEHVYRLLRCSEGDRGRDVAATAIDLDLDGVTGSVGANRDHQFGGVIDETPAE